jgi:SAM-dependent methyltransferase
VPALEVIAFARASLPAAPARVLEVGAGDGELADELREAGYDVVAIDPAGGPDGVRQVALLDLDEPEGSFDAAIAVVSLHHVDPLGPSCEHLARLVRRGGVLAVDELDVERLDERATAYWTAQRRAAGLDAPEDPAQMVADMREHIHALGEVVDALRPGFALGEPVRGCYLHRWHLPPGLRDEEERLIAQGELPATGARLVGVRR